MMVPSNNRWRGGDARMVVRRGRCKRVCARGGYRASVRGPSTSPLAADCPAPVVAVRYAHGIARCKQYA